MIEDENRRREVRSFENEVKAMKAVYGLEFIRSSNKRNQYEWMGANQMIWTI